ncbi:IS200/IS605 family transposase [Thermostichus vulcanus]|uniref:IS200/IS605 family transposase n=1 Tax=Thermostichus vulcanus str. 'Rupite' TaxID=2813851 RepID=A0ABT0C8E8_THEVL|nr:IS200/IS605 family transposase [Thermostichus vulcanus]MCJ2542029.1 IS200/IS605 family transposase [Thermostichus vulcanus str. 'Rupite']
MSLPLNTLYHCSYSIYFHLVTCTKYRRKCITQPMLNRLREIFAETLQKWEGELIEFNGEADHVHVLMSVNPKVQPSKLVNNLKTVSSRLIRKEFAEHLVKVYRGKPVFWNRSYCIISCGGAPLAVLTQYIQQQAKIE